MIANWLNIIQKIEVKDNLKFLVKVIGRIELTFTVVGEDCVKNTYVWVRWEFGFEHMC